MNNKYILDENGNPIEEIDLLKWGRWFETADRHIDKTMIGIEMWKFWLGKLLKIKRWEPCWVSTVFLGLNHNFYCTGPPLLFETMIFGGEHDQYQERYTTKKEAIEGHKRALKIIKGNKED